MRLEALLLCDFIVRDAPGGKVQLQGIFDVITANSFPAVHSNAWLYFRFYVDPVSVKPTGNLLQFRLRRPNRMTETLPNMTLDAIAPDFKIEGNAQLKNMPIFETGEHYFEMYFNNEIVGQFKFNVQQIAQQREVVNRGSVN